MPVIGYLHSGSLKASAPYLSAFQKRLSDTGLVEGRDYRWCLALNIVSRQGLCGLVHTRMVIEVPTFSPCL